MRADGALSEREIEELTLRGLRFLRGASTHPEVLRELERLGYTAEEHYLGWSLLLSLCGYRPAGEPLLVAQDSPAQAAIAALDDWAALRLPRARAALHRYHPAQEEYLFNSLDTQPGSAAVRALLTFLERVRALRDGTDPRRAGSRDEDRRAVQLLERRGVLDPAAEEWLATTIRCCEGLSVASLQSGEAGADAQRQGTAARLRAWLLDWCTTAAAGLLRYRYRVQLGLHDAAEAETFPPEL